MNKQLKDAVIDVSKIAGLGDNTTTMQNLFYGINHRGTGNPVPTNNDHYGLTFFTRPQLNLSYHNVLGVRQLHPLLNDKEYSLSRAIRAILDPISNRNEFHREVVGNGDAFTKDLQAQYDVVSSPLVDPLSPFIPLLGNTLVSLSGWPDLVGDTFTSTEGQAREAWSIIDGIGKIYTTYDLTATFRNVIGDPITMLMTTWLLYSLSVRQGDMVPWPSNVVEQRIDYTTRIYRLVLDPTRKYVKKIGACGAAFPTNNSLGAAFNFNSNTPTSEENREIPVQFRAMGAEYNDPQSIFEFNKLVQDWNPLMRPSDTSDLFSDPIGVKSNIYQRIDGRYKDQLNYRGYPQINPNTMELTWYANKDEWSSLGAIGRGDR